MLLVNVLWLAGTLVLFPIQLLVFAPPLFPLLLGLLALKLLELGLFLCLNLLLLKHEHDLLAPLPLCDLGLFFMFSHRGFGALKVLQICEKEFLSRRGRLGDMGEG